MLSCGRLIFTSFSCNCFNELSSLIPPVHTFTAIMHHASTTDLNHPYFFHVPNIKRKFNSSPSQRTTTFWNRPSHRCFLEQFHLYLFKSKVNAYLPSLVSTSYYHFSIHNRHLIHNYYFNYKLLSILVLGEI